MTWASGRLTVHKKMVKVTADQRSVSQAKPMSGSSEIHSGGDERSWVDDWPFRARKWE